MRIQGVNSLPSAPIQRDNLASVHLDAVRGLAALLVAVSHLRALFLWSTRKWPTKTGQLACYTW